MATSGYFAIDYVNELVKLISLEIQRVTLFFLSGIFR